MCRIGWKRERLKALDSHPAVGMIDGMCDNRSACCDSVSETSAKLAANDELELIYLHLQSMRNFASVKDKLVLTQPEPAPADTAPAAEEREQAATTH